MVSGGKGCAPGATRADRPKFHMPALATAPHWDSIDAAACLFVPGKCRVSWSQDRFPDGSTSVISYLKLVRAKVASQIHAGLHDTSQWRQGCKIRMIGASGSAAGAAIDGTYYTRSPEFGILPSGLRFRRAAPPLRVRLPISKTNLQAGEDAVSYLGPVLVSLEEPTLEREDAIMMASGPEVSLRTPRGTHVPSEPACASERQDLRACVAQEDTPRDSVHRLLQVLAGKRHVRLQLPAGPAGEPCGGVCGPGLHLGIQQGPREACRLPTWQQGGLPWARPHELLGATICLGRLPTVPIGTAPDRGHGRRRALRDRVLRPAADPQVRINMMQFRCLAAACVRAHDGGCAWPSRLQARGHGLWPARGQGRDRRSIRDAPAAAIGPRSSSHWEFPIPPAPGQSCL